MPNLLAKIKIAQLERAGVHYYDSIIPFFQKEMNAYVMKTHRVHLLAIHDKTNDLDDYVEAYFNFYHAYFSAINQIGTKELSYQNFIDSALGYSEESMVNLLASCFRNICAQFESKVKHHNFLSLKTVLENEFRFNIQKSLEKQMVSALKTEAQLYLSKSLSSPEVLKFRIYCEVLLAKDFKRLSAMPVPKNEMTVHPSMRRFFDLVKHAHELEFSLPPLLLQRLGFQLDNELPLKAKQLLRRYRSRLKTVDFEDFTEKLNHIVFSSDNIQQVYELLILMIDNSWDNNKFLKHNFDLLHEVLEAKYQGKSNFKLPGLIAQFANEYQSYEEALEFKNRICDVLRMHENEAVANQIMTFRR